MADRVSIDLPTDVAAAAERIRLSMLQQDADMLDRFGTQLGPPSPRPERADLLVILRHLGVEDAEVPAGRCGEPVELWGTTTYCLREPHAVSEDEPHRNRYGTTWYPTGENNA